MEDFIPVYPSMDDPDIQRIFTSKKEFNELLPNTMKEKSDDRRDERKDDRQLYNYQELFARTMVISDRMLNMYETGAGKTCAFIAGVEKYKFKGAFKKCIIVSSSDELNEGIFNKIVNTCTPVEEYSIKLTEEEEKEDNADKILKKRVMASLRKWYSDKTYEAFTRKLQDLDEDQIFTKYNNCIFIFDEAHNMVPIKENREKNLDLENRYKQFSKLCHNIPQSKICLLTATPMKNKPEELIKLMNLLLPIDGQIPMKSIYGLSELEPYFRGKISYIKKPTDKIKLKYMGKEMIFRDDALDLSLDSRDPAFDRSDRSADGPGRPDSKKLTNIEVPINMYFSTMGDLQEEQYVVPDTQAFRTRSTSDAALAFPIINGKITTSTDFIEESGSTIKWKSYPEFLDWSERGEYIDFKNWIYNGGDLSNLRRISGKLAEMIEIETTEPGCSFIYSSLVAGSGVKFMMMVMCLFGKFQQFTESNFDVIFNKQGKVKESFKKAPRIALITSGAFAKARQEMILKLFNSVENVNGEYIKIIIGSEKTKEGIDVFHCQRIHLHFPGWHWAGMTQAINRGHRIGGHVELRKYKVQKAIEMGLVEGTEEYKKYTDIEVKVYIHAIDYNLDENVRNISNNNNDYFFMKKAVKKEIKITRMMTILKICAVDNMINRERNIYEDDDPFNFYKGIKFIPSWTEITTPGYIPFITDPTDYSTYKILYFDPKKITNKIMKIIDRQGYISYDAIYDKFKEYSKQDIYETINNINSSGKYIENSLGEKMILKITHNGLLAQRFSYPCDKSLIDDISIYDHPSIFSIKRNLSSYLELYRTPMLKNIISKLVFYIFKMESSPITSSEAATGHPVSEEYIDFIKSKSRWIQVCILEELINLITGTGTSANARAIANYTPSPSKSNIIKFLNFIYEGYFYHFNQTDDEPEVWIHTMTVNTEQESTHAIYPIHKSPKNIKILSLVEKNIGWRLLTEEEDLKYRELIKTVIENKLAVYEKNSLYGHILQDGKFRIVDNRSGSDKKIAPEDLKLNDRRGDKRGKDSDSFKKVDRIVMAIAEKIYPPSSMKTKNESIKYLREAMKGEYTTEYINSISDEDVQIYNKWNQCTNLTKFFNIEITKKLRQEGRLYEPYFLTYKDQKM